MKTWILHLWERARTSFWFVPGLFTAGALVFAPLLIGIDREWRTSLLDTFPGLERISASGTRALISTAAGAMLTLAGLAFSGTLVAMTLASNQFGPRLLRNFIRTRSTQVTLGMLLSTFVYCLLVLRGIRGEEESEFVPHLAAFTGFLGTLASLGVFIYFIHRIATSLRADQVTADVYANLRAAIDRFFPRVEDHEGGKEDSQEDSDAWKELEDESPLPAPRDGYLLAIDLETLVERCADLDLRCRVLARPGHFLVTGAPLLAIPGARPLDDNQVTALTDCFLIGPLRTPEQDFEFEVLQLVEVALRALSPGINDPFTAITCIDFLGAANSTIARRRLPPTVHRDSDGQARVHSHPISLEGTLDASFNQLRQAGSDKPDIVIRLLTALAHVHRSCLDAAQREAVEKHARLIIADARRSPHNEGDLAEIEKAMNAFPVSAQPSGK